MQNIGKKLEQFFLSNSTVIAIIESPYFKMYENLWIVNNTIYSK